MVVRKRARAILVPLVLYGVSALVVGYFVHHAHNGDRGLDMKRQLKIQAHEITAELDELRAERADWERRIALLRSDQIDRDLLEERARTMLGRVHRNDLVVITGR
ncbi:MAG TPA: septum formation initiator family protein [Beijerinckiaceae bacterium]|nr:septum formation initiator family protein [Beijerinckiaceae bacterium]